MPSSRLGAYILSFAAAPARKLIRQWSGIRGPKQRAERGIAVEVNQNAPTELASRTSVNDRRYFDRSKDNINVRIEHQHATHATDVVRV